MQRYTLIPLVGLCIFWVTPRDSVARLRIEWAFELDSPPLRGGHFGTTSARY